MTNYANSIFTEIYSKSHLIMEKLPMHFPPFAGANLSLFGTFCHKNGMAGNNVMEMLEILSIFFK